MATAIVSTTRSEASARHRFNVGIAFVLLSGLCLAAAGCTQPPAGESTAAPPTITVSIPVEREVTDFADYTARTVAVDSVELRARVSGYLDKVNFKDGSLVKKGDILFEIDPRTYEATVKSAEGAVANTEASLKLAEANLVRAQRLVAGQSIAREEFDRYVADREKSAAQLVSNKASLERAKLDLRFTKITAPVGGRISRPFVTVGNLVQAGDLTGGTLLTTIVSVDPMYAYFDVDEHTVLRVKQLIREGKAKTPDDPDIPVWLGLANETGHPHRGTINFIDNQINPKTGTLRVRGVFRNQDELLSSGLFARVRVPIGIPHTALLVNERALDTDQGQKVLYVVDKDNKVVARPVVLGSLHDGLREITAGLMAGERVIVVGLQQVRPGMVVEPKLEQMPASAAKK